MRIVKPFHICIIIFLVTFARSDTILKDYGNGNKGLGVNDKVKGVNNTWVGNNNTIDGSVNTVVGHQNKIEGSNNIVEGNNNVIGDVSPQQIARLQNQMFATFEDRFKGMFNFNFAPQAKPETHISQQNILKPIIPLTKQVKNTKDEINRTERQSSDKLENNTLPHLQQQVKSTINTQQKVTKQQTSQVLITNASIEQETSKQQFGSTLLFRSYGSQYAQSDYQEIYYLQGQMEKTNIQLCKRWNYCLLESRSMRWSFSSIYPSFPFLIEL